MDIMTVRWMMHIDDPDNPSIRLWKDTWGPDQFQIVPKKDFEVVREIMPSFGVIFIEDQT